METSEIVSGYDEYRVRAAALAGVGGLTLYPFSDFLTASFGSSVLPASDFPEGAKEKEDMLRTMIASAPTITFYKFGSALSSTIRTVSSPMDLLSIPAVDGVSYFVTLDGVPAVVDYSDAPSGRSSVAIATRDGLRSLRPQDRMRLYSRFTSSTLWSRVLGYAGPIEVSDAAIRMRGI